MLGLATMASTLALIVIGAALGHLLVEPQAVWGASPGGAVGELLGEQKNLETEKISIDVS